MLDLTNPCLIENLVAKFIPPSVQFSILLLSVKMISNSLIMKKTI